MSRRHRKSRVAPVRAEGAAGAEQANAAGDGATAWLTPVVGVFLLARYFLPAESAALGETLWIVQFWLIAAVIWFWLRARGGADCRQWDGFDVAVGLLVGGHVLSAASVLLTEGDRRAALNMLWEWVGIGVATLMIRDGLQHQSCRVRLLRLVVLAAITLAGLGLWQHHVWYPALSAKLVEFDRLRTTAPADPQSAVDRTRRLRELGNELGPLMTGGDAASNQLLRARVASSTEPIGRFALANSFAALLLVGLLLGLGQLWRATGSGSATREQNVIGSRTGEAVGSRQAGGAGGQLRAGVHGWRWWAGCLLMLATAYCFWLTKSRTALIGLLSGVAVGIALSRRSGPWGRSLRWGVFAGGVLLIGLPVVAALAGGLDREVLTEAPKSLQYRLEYWTATGSVIRESPWLGTGPGNFRQAYLAHKLPGASEEVLDPHNLLLDVWTGGGLLALVGLLWLVAVLIRAMWRAGSATGLPETAPELDLDLVPDSATPTPRWTIPGDAAVGVAALLMAAFVSLMNGSGFVAELWWLAGGWCAVCLLWPRSTRPALPVLAAAAISLLVHLMGAGGIAMPAILQTLILVGASLVALQQPAAVRPSPPGFTALPAPLPWREMLAAGVVLCLAIACALTATLPVSAARTQVAVARAILADGGRPDEAIRTLQSAIEADPISSEAWQELAVAYAGAWRRHASGDEQTFQNAVQAQQEAIRLDPHAAGGWQMLGNLWWLKYENTVDAASAREALQAWTQAARRYPNLATLQGKLAEAASICGESKRAQQAASRALELEAANRRAGHVDKYLPESLRKRVATIAGVEAIEL